MSSKLLAIFNIILIYDCNAQGEPSLSNGAVVVHAILDPSILRLLCILEPPP